MELTGAFTQVPRDQLGRAPEEYLVTLSAPQSDPKARISIRRYTISLIGWKDVTHVQVEASRDVFVIRPCSADDPDAITLACGGKSRNALIRIAPLTEALGIEPGERFYIDIDVEGDELAGEWPEELRTRMSTRQAPGNGKK